MTDDGRYCVPVYYARLGTDTVIPLYMAIKVYMYSWSNYILLFKLLLLLLPAYQKENVFKNGYSIEGIVKGSWFKTESGAHLEFYTDGVRGPFSREERPEPKEVSSPEPFSNCRD